MSALLQDRPTTSNPKQRQRSHHGTSDKAHGRREATNRSQPHRRQAAPPETRSQPMQATEVVKMPVEQTGRKRSSLSLFLSSFSLVKCFTIFGFVVAVTHVVVFGLDLAIAWPLQRASVLYDINGVVCGLAARLSELGYVSGSGSRGKLVAVARKGLDSRHDD